MAPAVREFGQIAQRLVRNPLGIIALFIVLIYAFAVLLVGFSGPKLAPNERLPLVWFIILFPFVVLFTFYRLVANHHSKLYAPSDYRDERLFFHPLTPAEQQARIGAEVQELDEPATAPHQDARAAPPRLGGGAYLLAEELALRQLEAEIGMSFTRQVRISALPGVMFDGVAAAGTEVVFAEVKTARQPLFSPRIVTRVLDQFEKVRTSVGREGLTSAFRLYLLVVADMSDENQRLLEENLRRFLTAEATGIELRVYSLSGLRKQFGAEA